ncbi:MAG: SDR family oxidoreductase [Chloroflexi bacterium]|nr:SDR family oxidoreductase [Chloroflexota bacterium]
MAMDLDLTGRVAVVTGGGSGIGAAACLKLAEAGAAVAILDLRPEPAQAVAAQIAAAGGKALALAADVRDEEAVSAAITQAASTLGGLNIVFANAGINGMQTPIDEMTLDEWNATIGPNLTGAFLTVKHSIPHLRDAGGGSIVVTASVNGNTVFSQPGYAAYSTSKAGAVAFTKMAALELARWEIRVNAILPGAVQTNIAERTYRRNLHRVDYGFHRPEKWPPLRGAPAAASEIADLVLFLASDASRYMTGAQLLCDGASSLWRG